MGVGEVYAWEGRDDEAISQYKRVIELDPSFAGVYGNIAVSYQRKQDYADAAAAMKKEEQLNGNSEFAGLLERAYARGGFHAVLEQELKNDLKDRADRYVHPVGIAELYAQLGDTPRALQWLEKGYEAHASGMQFLAISNGFEGIRSDPGFRYWLSVLNLPGPTQMRGDQELVESPSR
jgi:tetratricopeptide (TPR) repeat protein